MPANPATTGETEAREAPALRADQPRTTVLIVDDDPMIAGSLATFVSREGHRAITCSSGEDALQALREAETAPKRSSAADPRPDPIGVVILDSSMPGMSGEKTLARIVRSHPDVAVIMLTGYGSIESAVEAVKIGAVDYLTKPVVDHELRLALDRAIRQQALMSENHRLRQRLDDRLGLDNIVGADHRMLRIYDLIEAVALSKTTALICGESGTGKSLIARAIHLRSPRRENPFVELSCGSIPESLLESELFGHVKGAFTGAHADKMGKFHAADGGTIFLDEINSASPAMQLKLLRVLQERKFEPVGSNETVEVDVRVVLATNQPLEALVATGQFRQDLYYRINVVRIELPPLRDRPGDIPLLAEHMLRRRSAEEGRQYVGFTAEALDALRRYRYPGNVRELENIIERATVLARRPTIGVEDLPPYVVDDSAGAMLPPHVRGGLMADNSVDSPDTPWIPTPLDVALQEPEKRILLKALRANNWNRQVTAEQLGINRTTLYKKMKALGIDRLAG